MFTLSPNNRPVIYQLLILNLCEKQAQTGYAEGDKTVSWSGKTRRGNTLKLRLPEDLTNLHDRLDLSSWPNLLVNFVLAKYIFFLSLNITEQYCLKIYNCYLLQCPVSVWNTE